MKNDTLIRHKGMHLNTLYVNGTTPTRITRFTNFISLVERGMLKGQATRQAFLRLENRPSNRGYWTDFFAAAVRTGKVNVTKGPKGAYVYSLPKNS